MSETSSSASEHTEFVARHLEQAQVIVDLPADDIDTVIQILVDRLVAEDQLPAERRDETVRVVQSRERESSTALGQGLAVPHARVSGLKGSRVVFGRLETSLNLGAPDGRPVRFVALLLTGDDHELHLEFLMSIARMMSDGVFVADAHLAPDEPGLRRAIEQYFQRSREFEVSSIGPKIS